MPVRVLHLALLSMLTGACIDDQGSIDPADIADTGSSPSVNAEASSGDSGESGDSGGTEECPPSGCLCEGDDGGCHPSRDAWCTTSAECVADQVCVAQSYCADRFPRTYDAHNVETSVLCPTEQPCELIFLWSVDYERINPGHGLTLDDDDTTLLIDIYSRTAGQERFEARFTETASSLIRSQRLLDAAEMTSLQGDWVRFKLEPHPGL